MTNSVESRFVAIISGALLTVVAPLFTLFLILSTHEAQSNLHDHIEILLVANSQALGKPLWDMDAETINQVTGSLVSDPAIRIVRVRDTLGQLDIVQTSGNGGSEELGSVTRIITFKTLDGLKSVGTITVHYAKIGLLPSLTRIELAFTSIFVLAILTVFGASIIGNRLMIIKPLLRLTAAIEATRRLGSRHHVDWRSNDEMGQLARSFNEMQIQLEREEQEIKRAHHRTTEIYNRTPAMLFSLDDEDRITAVSDYWLEAAGYAREEVIGRAFAELVAIDDRKQFTLRNTGSEDSAGDVTVRFIKADGSLIDVLIMERKLDTAEQGAIASSLSVMTDVTELRRSEQRNRQQAISDHLTGLLNRQGFEAELDAQIRKADLDGCELACLFVDLDRFKQINDTLGHAAGDAMLAHASRLLAENVGKNDLVARIGGDEFVIVARDYTSAAEIRLLANNIISAFRNPITIEGVPCRCGVSIGIALGDTAREGDARAILINADIALYRAKATGRNCYQFFTQNLQAEIISNKRIADEILAGLENGEFVTWYQPQICSRTMELNGAEALIRWNHPTRGILTPEKFLDIAEDLNVVAAMDRLVLETALRDRRLWDMQGAGIKRVSVNVSSRRLHDESLIESLESMAIIPGEVAFELVESIFLDERDEIATSNLDRLKAIGVDIEIDDFGTGHTSIISLLRLKPHRLKIDRQLVMPIISSPQERALVASIIEIAHTLGVETVAEGVESMAHSSMLRGMGCDHLQGYAFARPLPAAEFAAFAKGGQWRKVS